ncbi:MAG: DUF3604 domain-containing protein [Deltaproteobacteria bacterium]|nr:DUF3604 domain-containing protein [Deltaproteobacteria bacterium]
MRGFAGDAVFEMQDEILALRQPPSSERVAFFGDLHVHTTYSFDAYAFGTLATPYDAYRYARGEAIQHPAGFEVQLRQPLDFYAVTDHAMFLGVAAAAGDTSTDFSKLDVAKPLNDLNAPDNRGFLSLLGRVRAFSTFLPNMVSGVREGSIDREAVLGITRTAWRDTVDAAELFDERGRFTTFIGFEYTSATDDSGNLHRNVIFRGSEKIPAVPFSRFHSQNPEGLWDWMDGLRKQGIESLAIPHNSNGSNGQMFKLVDWAGDPMDDAYAEQRIRNEPLVEITQVKGTSETHPLLSTRDEWADFEIMPYRVATMLPSEPAGSYVRDALRRGLALESKGIANPYRFGFVGSSDTHTGATSDDESNFFSKVGLLDATPGLRGSVPLSFLPALALRFTAPQMRKEVDGKTYLESATPTYGASGLAGVWAEENTREAIYEAFRRKETFATSGPRIRLRFFAGYDFEDEWLDAPDVVARAYAAGVTMGGDLPARTGGAPRFLLWALADAQGAPLQRLQIVKGWVDSEGETFEVVYDVACSGGASVDPDTHRCPDNGARVDLSDCGISRDAGAAQLQTLWRDPAFDPGQRAFYYARVLENPTCRWSTWDALRAGVSPRSDLPKTIQERAWSSPIHYLPSDSPTAGG